MENKVNRKSFNICDQVNLDKAIRSVENIVSNCNNLLNDLKSNGIGSFLTFDIAMSIIKDGKEGLKDLSDKVIQEAQRRVLLTQEKEEAKARYNKFFTPYQAKADIVRRDLHNKSGILTLNLFAWNDEAKELVLIKGYKDKLKPLYVIEAKDYHYAYMERLKAYVEAKNELIQYHALTYAFDYPTQYGIARMRGHYKDDNMVFFNPDTFEYSYIDIDKLMLTGIHEPDPEEILKKRIY